MSADAAGRAPREVRTSAQPDEREAADLAAQNARLARTQRAMLNVIEDLRDARATLAARVEERTRRVFEVLEEMQDSFFALDRDMVLTLVNQRHEATLGVPRAASIGRRFYDVFPVSTASKLWTELHQVRDERVARSFVEHEPGRDVWLEVSASPSSDGGVAVFYRDVTARVRLELERAALLENERRARLDAEAARAQSDRANRTKDQFLSTVSHELRTPLNAILGWAQMLRAGQLDEGRRGAALETIERNARAQVRLIEDLLDFGRILQGKFKLAVGPMEAVRVVEAALESLAPAAELKGVRIQPTLDSHATIVGDSDRLQQIVWNLVSNAIKFTPRGGRVHVTLRRAKSYVELNVSDTGRGISPDFLPHVFEPFRQSDGAHSPRAGGLGLGLSIVRSLVELHGGTVSAASEGPDRGATFVVRIPIAPVLASIPDAASSAADGPPPFDRPAALEGIRVLVVDDEKDTRELVAYILERCKAIVVTAPSAADALAQLDASTFDVIVSDVGMPEEDGLSMMRRLRARPPHRGGTITAVALTAYSRSEDRAHAIRAGFDSHLAKPVDASELSLVVAAAVRKHR